EPMESGKSLTFLRHHAVPVEIPIRTDVHHDFEAEVCILERSTNLLPPGRTIPEIPLEEISPGGVVETAGPAQRFIPATLRLLEDDPSKNLRFRFGVMFDEPNLRFRSGLDLVVADEITDGG